MHAKIVDPPHLHMKLKPMGQLCCLATWKDNVDEKWSAHRKEVSKTEGEQETIVGRS